AAAAAGEVEGGGRGVQRGQAVGDVAEAALEDLGGGGAEVEGLGGEGEAVAASEVAVEVAPGDDEVVGAGEGLPGVVPGVDRDAGLESGGGQLDVGGGVGGQEI